MPRASRTQKLALIVGATLLALGTIELGLRALGWAYLRARDRQNEASLATGGTVRILCLGESTTGLGGTASYPRQLDRILNQGGGGLGFTVINEGLSGTTTDRILERLDALLDRYQPQVVVTMMGINDGWWWALSHEDQGGLSRLLAPLSSLRLVKLLTLAAEHVRAPPQADEHCGAGRLDDIVTDEPMARAARLAAGREFDAAYAITGARLAERPTDLVALGVLKILDVLQTRGDFQRAMSHAETILLARLGASPDDATTRRDLGWLYVIWGKLEEASVIAAATEDAGADCLRLHVARHFREAASRFVRNGQPTEAIDALEHAARVLPARAANDRMRTDAQLARAQRLAGDAAGAEAAEHAAAALEWSGYSERTQRNYRALKATLDRRRIRLVAVQYPTRSLDPLRRMLDDAGDVVFVDNEQTFREALRTRPYDTLFSDEIAGDFGHLTPEGNALLAGNVAQAMRSALGFGVGGLDRNSTQSMSSRAQ
jgi:lysophospholipase L1-like esterase